MNIRPYTGRTLVALPTSKQTQDTGSPPLIQWHTYVVFLLLWLCIAALVPPCTAGAKPYLRQIGELDYDFSTPTDIAVSPTSGDVWVTDHLDVLHFNARGDFLGSWQTPWDDDPWGVNYWINPCIAVDPRNDTVYCGFLHYTGNGILIRSLDDPAHPTVPPWGMPVAAAVDENGSVYLMNNYHGIDTHDSSGAKVMSWEWNDRSDILHRGTLGIAVGARGIYTSCYDCITLYTNDDDVVEWVVSGGEDGRKFLRGMALDPSGETLFVTDTRNDWVQWMTVGDRTLEFAGMMGSEGDKPTQFRDPTGIDVSSNGVVYIADTGNSRVSLFVLDDDESAPETTISSTMSDWSSERPATFTLTAEDDEGGTGVAQTWYQIGEQFPRLCVGKPVETWGATTVTYWSVDNIGNPEEPKTTRIGTDYGVRVSHQ